MKTGFMRIGADWKRPAPWLSETERRRLQGMRHPGAARQSAHAWVAVKALAGRDGEVWHDATGRPHLRGSELHVGIAHKAGLAFVAVDDSLLGVDLEDFDQPLALDSFLKGTRAPGEGRAAENAIAAGLALSRHEVAILCWSLKEAACKWAGRPLIPRQCRVRAITTGGTATLEFADGGIAPELAWGTMERHVFCVAARHIVEPIRPSWICPTAAACAAGLSERPAVEPAVIC